MIEEEANLKISAVIITLISFIFIDMAPVYFKKDFIVGFCVLGVALVNVFLLVGIKFGYNMLVASISGVSALTSILLRGFHGVQIANITIPWWGIALMYILIFILAVYSNREEEIKKIGYIVYPILGSILLIGIVIAYGSFSFPIPPDAARGITAATKEKTWRSMGLLLGALNLGMVYSIIKGRYLVYLLLVSFMIAPLVTFSIAVKAVTFGIFSQVLFLLQIYVGGLIVSWHMGAQKVLR